MNNFKTNFEKSGASRKQLPKSTANILKAYAKQASIIFLYKHAISHLADFNLKKKNIPYDPEKVNADGGNRFNSTMKI